MNSAITQAQSATKGRIRGTTIALVVSVAVATAVLLTFAGDFLIDPDVTVVMLVSLVFFAMLAFAAGYGRDRAQSSKWLILIIWWGLLVSEEVFSYRSTLTSTSTSDFASEAYAQGILWLIALFGLLVVLVRSPQQLRGLFQGDYKWVSWIAVASILSSVYSPNPAFSLAWAFKLGLIVVVVHVCSREMTEIEDMRKFLYVTIFAFVFLTVLPTLRSLFEADPLGEYGSRDLEQRFREAPTELSAIAGLLVLLCLMVYSRGRRRWPLAVGALGFILMIVAGGKTGIVAGFVSGLLFYALQRRVKAALGFAAVMLIAMVLALEFTPLAAYMQNYSRLEQFSSFTGRTGLWQFVLPYILQRPILGHGFNSSRFIAVLHPDTPFSSAHMHNSLLEAFYDNGLIGLGLVLMILFVIARNLYRVMRSTESGEVRYLAVGGMAALVNLFINGMLNSTFGGRPDASYMMLIALVVISTHLLRMSQNATDSRTLAASV